jgi:hypothetical protein
MKIKVRFFPAVICVVVLFSIPALAQNPSSKTDSVDTMASEIGLLRKSLDTLSVRLREMREVNEKALALDMANEKQTRISLNLDLLTRAEQRAEMLRKQLLELIEKETTLKSRAVQIEEDMRPENIERTTNLAGTTRPAELREARRKVLDTERRGVASLLNQIAEGRDRLEDDVRQADLLVSRLRQRLLPLIEREIERINSN